jgi:hypothetical protein
MQVLVGKFEGNKPFGRIRRTSEDDIKMNLRETGWDKVNWIDLTTGRDMWRARVKPERGGSLKWRKFIEQLGTSHCFASNSALSS